MGIWIKYLFVQKGQSLNFKQRQNELKYLGCLETGMFPPHAPPPPQSKGL